ncbi:M23 family metallopeptidase [Tenacibaculum maritimum]|uniref:M23 family metallopeptidase n=1 Tax=Tenacibaculum maritimum TaxID=107401 RepID=UPI00132FECCD
MATHDGNVLQAQENSDKTEGVGRRVAIQSKDGTFQKYFHLRVFLVDKGGKVKEGQVIGEIGASAFGKEKGIL